MKLSPKYHWDYLWIICSAALAYLPFLGVVHLFDWDEINFAESAREMLLTGDYFRVTVNFDPFWEKPPLFFWLQSLSMRIFGINEFAARLPNALFGVLSLITIYAMGVKEKGVRFARIWVLAFGTATLPFFYFKSGIIDPVFNYFIFLSFFLLYRAYKEKRIKWYLLAGITNGLAVLTKGPVGLLLILLGFAVVLIIQKFKNFPSIQQILTFTGSWLMVTFLWYGFELIQNGPWFLVEFINYQMALFSKPIAGHEQPFYYHFVVVFLGCFPMSVWALQELFRPHDKSDFAFWNKVLFWVVLILFTIVTTKIVHYSSMAYLPLSFLSALALNSLIEKEEIMPKWSRWVVLFVGLTLSIVFFFLGLVLVNKDLLIPHIQSQFILDSLSIAVNVTGFEPFIGVFYLILVVVGFVIISKKTFLGVKVLAIGNAVFLWFVLILIVPKVERYSQGPAIDFYQKLRGGDVYVKNIGFKSYAQYFYFEQPSNTRDEARDVEWLKNGEIDKDVFFITKSTYKGLEDHPEIQFLEQSGGYKMYVRKVKVKGIDTNSN